MRNKILLWTLGAWLFASFFVVLNAVAQDFRATLTGLVTDPSGATVTGAKVTAVNNASGTSYNAVTTAGGRYFIPYVLPGTYTVSVDANGFKTSVQDKVLLQNSTTFNQNFQLSVGAVDQKVVVTDAPPLIETSTGSGGTIIDSREVQNVPLNGGQSSASVTTCSEDSVSAITPSTAACA